MHRRIYWFSILSLDAYGLIISTKELLQKQLSVSNHPNILHSLYGSEFDFSSLKIKDVVTKLNEVKNSYQLSNLREGPYKNPEDTQFVNKLYEKYKSRSSDLNFLKLIGSIIELKLSSLSDVRILKTLELHHTRTLADDASNLANYLSNIQNSKDREIKGMFTEIQNQFEDIFNKKISMDCYQDSIEEYTGKRTERKIIPRLIFNKLNGLQLGIDEVGTGVIEVLTLLTKSRTEKNTMILMDEPALHLHPIQIRVTFEKILENISNSDSQAIFISHSTNLPLLSFIKNENEILYIKMKEAKTTVSQPDEDSKKWLVNVWDRLYFDLEPEVFYSKLVILVEGDSDYGFLKGLSQRLGKDLQINDIFISQINGKRNLPIFLKLLSAFDIPYLVLADRDALIEISKDEYSAILLALKEKDPNILEELKKSFNISKISSTEREPRFVKRLKNDFKDKDAKIKKLITEIAKKYTNKTKEYSDNIKSLFEFAKKNNVFVIQEGDIEDLMETTDSALYEELRKKWKGNKRQTAREFAQKLDDKKLDKMAVLVEVLDASIDRVSN